MKTEKEIKEELLFRKLQQKAAKTCKNNGLLASNDRVLVGLSGGKDSMVLLEILTFLRKKLPFTIDIIAVHVTVTGEGFSNNAGFLDEFCSGLNIQLHKLNITPELQNPTKSPCFICSWHRRKAIFDLGKKLNCNKLSFGHHRDDAVNTFMMNMLYHGSLSSLPYSLTMFDGRVKLIRPLLDIWEEEIEEYFILKDYPSVQKVCSYENSTKRMYVNDILRKINRDNPGAKNNIFRSMGNSYPDYLPTRAPI